MRLLRISIHCSAVQKHDIFFRKWKTLRFKNIKEATFTVCCCFYYYYSFLSLARSLAHSLFSTTHMNMVHTPPSHAVIDRETMSLLLPSSSSMLLFSVGAFAVIAK